MTDNHNHELQLIVCCIIDTKLIEKAAIIGVQYDWFTNKNYRDIWQHMVKRYTDSGTIDIIWLNDFVKEHMGEGALKSWVTKSSEAISAVLTPRAEVMSAIEIMKRNHDRRKLFDIIGKCHQKAHTDEPVALIRELVAELSNTIKVNKDEKEYNLRGDIIADLTREIDAPTGFPTLDFYTKGIEPGAFWTIGGFTSNGKTMLALNIAVNLAKKDKQVTYFSNEMNEKQLTKRIATVLTGVNPSLILGNRKMQKEDFDMFLAGVDEAMKLPMYVCKTLSLSEIRMSIQKRQSRLYVVDYLQNIVPDIPIDSERERLGHITRELEIMTKQYDVCIIATSQFNRPEKKDGKPHSPSLSSYRGSGEIEQNTDIGILMYYPFVQATFEQQEKIREQGTENMINVALQKNRLHGLTGVMQLHFNRKNMQLHEIKKEE